MLTLKCPGAPIQSDSRTSDSLNVAMLQYYWWMRTSVGSDKSVAHQRAWVLLIKDLQTIVQCICEKNILD